MTLEAELNPVELDDPAARPDATRAETPLPGDGRPLSLRAQLTIWFAFSFGIILATVVLGIALLDGGRVFDGEYEHYDWLIRLELIAASAVFVLGVAAVWITLGVAVEPLRRITEAAKGVAPERIEDTRIDMPEVGTEVDEARRELNRALDRIEAGYQTQERFISNVSHELKTPIAVLSLEAQRLQRMERPHEELVKFVDETSEQMSRLGKMVESFLTLARIDYEARMRKNEEYWFHDLLLEGVSRSRAQALTYDVHIELELPEDLTVFDEPTWGDPELVSSAVENLIRNAIRFTPRQSTVQVSLTADLARPERVGDESGILSDEVRHHAIVQVRDDGPGMPDDLIATVFEPFQQAEGERERGTGLGLAIAHKVTTLHRGTIRAFNRTDGEDGCVVEMRLPFLAESDWATDRDLNYDGLGSGVRERAEP